MRCARVAAVLLAVCAAVASAGPASRPVDGRLASLDFRQVVQRAKEQVFPAVVFIKCVRESHESGRKVSQEIAGSGVLISPTGELLTNHHVVDKAVEVRCLLYDGRAMDAKVLGTDKDTDLALVRLECASGTGDLPCATLGDSTQLKEGDFVMAMGAPWGLNRSVSLGIVACTRRFLPGRSEYSLWLQTDASISPGNSGGPLVNTDGHIVGITTLGAMSGGDLGFAIPSETIRYLLPQLRQFGRMNWSWTGLQLQPLKDFNRNMYFEGQEGVIVAETDPESPARRAGIQPRDRILSIDGTPVTALQEEDLPEVRRRLGLLEKHKPATFALRRGSDALTIEIAPREKGKVEGEELDCPRWDLTLKAVNRFDSPDLYFYRTEGVFVYGVKYPGNARDAGLQTKDIVVKIDGRDVTTLAEVKALHAAALEGIATRHRVVLTVLRGGLVRQVVLDFSRDYEKE